MSHSKSKIWVHAVFATKDRQPLITPIIRPTVHSELRNQLITMACFVDCIGGVTDHVHLLFLLNPKKSMADVVKQIKGGSSHMFNQTKLTATHFAWQIGYGAFSVSESHVPRVRAYILNQEEHHRNVTFMDEYRRFMVHYGLPVDEIG
ncbi:IS200/IS605 family transposase [Spirosoma sp. HMF4905]|uniref:IS200/IS605 family transposase n=1 Tax=Spirosoma arboris TaxID=2682092 RepID=A0A7K1SIK3_9BACT|nr:IS200/IS605 family transposase [Spirosoma arboris]MVM33558.1 IS200/IS605 family transposase [Spirosoma arboris]